MTPSGRPWILAIDTATSEIVVAVGEPDGTWIDGSDEPALHRHAERLLPVIEALTERHGLDRAALAGIVVGTGPGAFTGLRVGLGTAKTLAHELGCPIVGIPSAAALLVASVDEGALDAAEAARAVVLLPAGARDRVAVPADGTPVLIGSGVESAFEGLGTQVAVDLAGRAPEDAVRRGAAAVRGLGRAMLRMGALRLAAGAPDDVARLVPEYVTLPRSAGAGSDPEGGVAWSRDPR